MPYVHVARSLGRLKTYSSFVLSTSALARYVNKQTYEVLLTTTSGCTSELAGDRIRLKWNAQTKLQPNKERT
jgi:hypothetical protein